MSRNKEYVSPAGLRTDGRRPLEVRRINANFGVISSCDGSCTFELGNAKVCVSVFGPRECFSKQEARHDQVLITCEVAIAAFASEYRRNPQRRNKIAEDIASAVIQVASSIVLKFQYPNSQIHMYVEILRQDGSEKVACINAACLALIDASIAMRDAVCCVNVGLIENTVLSDLTAEEMRSQCVMISLAVTAHNVKNILWIETSSRLSPNSADILVKNAQHCLESQVWPAIRGILEEHTNQVFKVQN